MNHAKPRPSFETTHSALRRWLGSTTAAKGLACVGLFVISALFLAACANTSGSCNGEAVGDRKTQAQCDAPHFAQVPGCVKAVTCADFHDVVACQMGSCAVSAENLCVSGFAPCLVDGGTLPTDQVSCNDTPGCRWDTLCLTAARCADYHTQDTCSAVPYCDWEPNPSL